MKILIADNESYLANSIAARLEDVGHECQVVQKLPIALNAGEFDVVLLSTSWGSGDVLSVIEKHKNAVVIMLVSYISNDTVVAPINAGATDYIQKPFMIEELIKKIDHHVKFKELSYAKECFDTLLNALYSECNTPKIKPNAIKFPLFLKGTNAISRLAYAYKISQTLEAKIIILGENSPNFTIKNEIIFVQKFDKFSENKRAQILQNFGTKRLILDICDIEFKSEKNEILLSPYQGENKILSLEEYLRFAILAHQGEYFDSELANMLGISRKSLWEKRKKYGIARKK